MSHLSERDRYKIQFMYASGTGPSDIAKQLHINRDTVYRWIRKENNTDSVSDDSRSGRPTKIDNDTKQAIVSLMEGKQHASTRNIAGVLRDKGINDISYRTVAKVAHEEGLYPYHRPPRPMLSSYDMQRRLRFARSYLNFGWEGVVFSDESGYQLNQMGNTKNDVMWCHSASEVDPKEKVSYDTSVKYWVGMSIHGFTPVVFIDGPFNTDTYMNILQSTLLPFLQNTFNHKTYTFQQDNSPVHTSKKIQQYIHNNLNSNITPGEWPPHSPDLNPIENVFSIIDEKMSMKKMTTKNEIKKFITQLYKNFSNQYISSLYNSMNNRMQAVIDSKGGHTTY
jgi:transposase